MQAVSLLCHVRNAPARHLPLKSTWLQPCVPTGISLAMSTSSQETVMSSWHGWLQSGHNAFELTPAETAAWWGMHHPPIASPASRAKPPKTEPHRLARQFGRHVTDLVLQLGETELTVTVLREQADWFVSLIRLCYNCGQAETDAAVAGVLHIRDVFVSAIQDRIALSRCMDTSDFLPPVSQELTRDLELDLEL